MICWFLRIAAILEDRASARAVSENYAKPKEEVRLKIHFTGTTHPDLLAYATGIPDRSGEVHICPSGCVGEPHSPGLVHSKLVKLIQKAKEGKVDWELNLETETVDELEELRKKKAELEAALAEKEKQEERSKGDKRSRSKKRKRRRSKRRREEDSTSARDGKEKKEKSQKPKRRYGDAPSRGRTSRRCMGARGSTQEPGEASCHAICPAQDSQESLQLLDQRRDVLQREVQEFGGGHGHVEGHEQDPQPPQAWPGGAHFDGDRQNERGR